MQLYPLPMPLSEFSSQHRHKSDHRQATYSSCVDRFEAAIIVMFDKFALPL
jgi:hypothetical protein